MGSDVSITNSAPAVPRSRARKLRNAVLNAALLTFSIAVALLILEFAVRMFLPFYAPERQVTFRATTNGIPLGPLGETIRQRTPKGDYDLQITFNSIGFRDTRNVWDFTESDWFVLGDSFSFGWGVPEGERYSNLLEAHLKSNALPIRVFNIAIPENIIGYQRLLAYAERKGARVRHLVVGICMENDIRDYSDGRTADERDRLRLPAASKKETLRARLKERSALYVAASHILQSSPVMRRLLEKAGIARNIQILSGKSEWNPKAIESSRDELLKVVDGRNALILIIPARRLWHKDEAEIESRVHDSFVKLLRDAGLRVVDMRPVFEKTANPLAHYFKTDPHWNAQGHTAAAVELANAINALSDAAK